MSLDHPKPRHGDCVVSSPTISNSLRAVWSVSSPNIGFIGRNEAMVRLHSCSLATKRAFVRLLFVVLLFHGAAAQRAASDTIQDPCPDDCATETISISEGVFPFENTCASMDGPPTPFGQCGQPLPQIESDIWFCYTPSSAGTTTFGLCDSSFDTRMAIYLGCTCPASSTQINCNDDACGDLNGFPFMSQLTLTVNIGESYLIRIGALSADAAGVGVLDVSLEACIVASSPEIDTVLNDQGVLVDNIKNRFLSFRGLDVGRQQAVRVTFVDLPDPYHVWNGTELWVQAPTNVSEFPGVDTDVPPTFRSAQLMCQEPVYMDWASMGIVHVHHEGIIPGGRYHIQLVDDTCQQSLEASYSAPLDIVNGVWGDAVGSFSAGTGSWTAPDGVVRVPTDIVSMLNKFRGLPGSPIKTRVDLEPSTPNLIINIGDIMRGLSAFRGFAYPFSPSGSPCDS